MDIASYDEFAMLRENAEEIGLALGEPPAATRRFADVGAGRRISGVVWGETPPELVLLHGGAQNAHTWDTVALALARPCLAIDLPGHGHSDWTDDHRYDVAAMGQDVSAAIAALAPRATMAVGVGLGAPVALLAADHLRPTINRLVMVDSTAGAQAEDASPHQSEAAANVMAFTAQHHFSSFDELLQRTVDYNPGRSRQSLRRGLLHNARELPDGSWSWRWDPRQQGPRDFAYGALGAALDRFEGPVLVVRGERSDVVTDEAASAFAQRHPRTRLVTIEGADHAVQGNRPVELAQVLLAFAAEPPD